MQRLSLVDETFDFNCTKEYNISILASQDGFSFSILDAQNTVICLYHLDTFSHQYGLYLKKLKSVYDEVDLLRQQYGKTRVYYSAPDKTTIVPKAFFRPELATDFYNATFDASAESEILYSFIPAMDSFTVFEIPLPVHAFLKEKHPGIEIMNDLVLSAGKTVHTNNILKIRILKKHVIIISINAPMHFYNAFYYETENDLLYYILGAVKNMELSPDDIILDGIVNKHSNIYHRLRQYFGQVNIAANNKELHYSPLIDRLPDSRFVNLFNSFSCE